MSNAGLLQLVSRDTFGKLGLRKERKQKRPKPKMTA